MIISFIKVFYPIFDLPVQSLQTICGWSIPPPDKLSTRQKAMCTKLISSGFRNTQPTSETITMHHWVHIWFREENWFHNKHAWDAGSSFASMAHAGMLWKWQP